MATTLFPDSAAVDVDAREDLRGARNNGLRHPRSVDGSEEAAFESDIVASSGMNHCVGAARGTNAPELIFRALSTGAGDDVILAANTLVAKGVVAAPQLAPAQGDRVFDVLTEAKG